ncbi:hypothetical protein cyc_07742 [Cyclospora cayetanensis]|uniref:Protein HGH1 C-terminal domain-containing protein n=1 Tax=Cyclospora cayetanensis TaxID=88456 RepID=A0A1D3D5Y2_9EIME|nr:hypothetical protein cyc_07742 [Cyclospora cayetanensis]
MADNPESSYMELLELLEQPQQPKILLQVLSLLLHCSGDVDFIQFLIRAFSDEEQGRQQEQSQRVVRLLRRLLRLIGGREGSLSAMSTEIFINLTANEELAALMLQEYKDMTNVLIDNLKRQQQQQQRQLRTQPIANSNSISEGEDDMPLHLGVSLMLLSNVTRHKLALDAIFSPHLPLPVAPPSAAGASRLRVNPCHAAVLPQWLTSPSFLWTVLTSRPAPLRGAGSPKPARICDFSPPLCSLEAASPFSLSALFESCITERQRLRFLHPAVDASSYGPAADPRARTLAVECLAALATSPHARETLRWFGVYEVLRAVFCIETEQAIRDKVEQMVHVLVFSEEELQQQDRQLQQTSYKRALCAGDADEASGADAVQSS